MSFIITNPKVAGKNTMSDLELRARKGDPFAQDELERQAFIAAEATKKLQRGGLSRKDAQQEMRERHERNKRGN